MSASGQGIVVTPESLTEHAAFVRGTAGQITGLVNSMGARMNALAGSNWRGGASTRAKELHDQIQQNHDAIIRATGEFSQLLSRSAVQYDENERNLERLFTV